MPAAMFLGWTLYWRERQGKMCVLPLKVSAYSRQRMQDMGMWYETIEAAEERCDYYNHKFGLDGLETVETGSHLMNMSVRQEGPGRPLKVEDDSIEEDDPCDPV